MPDNRKSFVLSCDYLQIVNKLPDDKAGQLFKIILQYVNDENPIIDDLLLIVAFEPIKQQLQSNMALYEQFIEKQSSNGRKGGRPKEPKALDENGEEIKTWKNDFLIYSRECLDALRLILADNEFINSMQNLYSTVNIKKTIVNAYDSYWKTEAAWKKKKKEKTENINWQSTFRNALNMSSNRIYLTKEELSK